MRDLMILSALLGLSLAGCFPSGTGSDRTIPDLGTQGSSADYSVAGDSILYRYPGEEFRSCIGDSMFIIPGRDGTTGERFHLSGDSLIQIQEFMTPDSGAVVRYENTSIRLGAGTGLDGTWKSIEESYAAVSGTLAADEKRILDRMSGNPRGTGAYWQDYQVFKDGKRTIYREWHRAVEFVDDWNGLIPSSLSEEADSSRYSIQVRILNNRTVELQGLKSLESVRIEMMDNGDISYASSRKERTKHLHLGKPSHCPNPYSPDWYWEFLEANLKVPVALGDGSELEKAGAEPWSGLSSPKLG
jgi:hypothetical protein